jgi:hypothetical protein
VSKSCSCGKVVVAAAPSLIPGSDSRGATAKLEAHEQWAPAAIRYLIDWLREEPETLMAMGRGRHAEGHYRYGDSVMYEYDQRTLVAEAAQELADAINYIGLFLQRGGQSQT